MSGVPVAIAAKVYGKDPCWVRAGIIEGWLPIGIATRKGRQITNLQDMDSRKGRINYYISPLRLKEETGYDWNRRSEEDGSEEGDADTQMGYI